MSFCLMKDSILEKTNFSKIVLKLDSKEIGIVVCVSVIFSFKDFKDRNNFFHFKLSEVHPSRNRKSVLLITFDEYFNS